MPCGSRRMGVWACRDDILAVRLTTVWVGAQAEAHTAIRPLFSVLICQLGRGWRVLEARVTACLAELQLEWPEVARLTALARQGCQVELLATLRDAAARCQRTLPRPVPRPHKLPVKQAQRAIVFPPPTKPSANLTNREFCGRRQSCASSGNHKRGPPRTIGSSGCVRCPTRLCTGARRLEDPWLCSGRPALGRPPSRVTFALAASVCPRGTDALSARATIVSGLITGARVVSICSARQCQQSNFTALPQDPYVRAARSLVRRALALGALCPCRWVSSRAGLS